MTQIFLLKRALRTEWHLGFRLGDCGDKHHYEVVAPCTLAIDLTAGIQPKKVKENESMQEAARKKVPVLHVKHLAARLVPTSVDNNLRMK